MNTGFLGPAVATVLTACGIETIPVGTVSGERMPELQQYLPLAVLKPDNIVMVYICFISVATVLTACGIET